MEKGSKDKEYLDKALEYARNKHSGQYRKDGKPYIVHPVAVAEMLSPYGVHHQIAGLFHDLLEDTDATESEILALSNPEVLEAVKLVTKQKGYEMATYIRDILANPMAKAVKNADRINNLTDAVNAKATFSRRYLEETEKWFLGQFSEELDAAYRSLKENVNSFRYTIDASDGSPLVYRSCNEMAWVFQDGIWKKTDPTFREKLGDNAKEISEAEASEIVGSSI